MEETFSDLPRLHKLASALNFSEPYTPFIEARKAIYSSNLEQAFDLQYKAFHSARYRDIALSYQVCHEALSLGCFLFTQKADLKQPRKDIWTRILHLRKWCLLNRCCLDLIEPDTVELKDNTKRLFIENGRRLFEGTFGLHLSEVKKTFFKKSSMNTAIFQMGEKPEYKTNLRHPSKIIKDQHFRDNSALMTAIVDHDKESALKLIAQGADLNFVNSTNDHAFSYAMDQKVWPERYEIASAILDSDISAETLILKSKKWKMTALDYVISQGQPLLLKKIIAKGCDLNCRIGGEAMIAPLYFAIQSCGDPGQLLNQHIGEPNGRLAKISKSFMKVVSQDWGSVTDRVKIIQLLLDNGAEIDAINTNGFTALTLATEFKLAPIVKLLLDAGANPNHRTSLQATALSYAVTNDDLQIAEYLLQSGASSDILDYRKIPLDRLCQSASMQSLISSN